MHRYPRARKRLSPAAPALAALLVALSLCGCAPGTNTLAVGRASSDFRLQNVEAAVMQAQDDIRELKGRQAQVEARWDEIRGRLDEIAAMVRSGGTGSPGGAPAPASALGAGFLKPGQTPPAASAQTMPAATVQPPAQTSPAAPAPAAQPGRAPAVGPESAAKLAEASANLATKGTAGLRPFPTDKDPKGKTAPLTPEKAVADDRAGMRPDKTPAAGPKPAMASALEPFPTGGEARKDPANAPEPAPAREPSAAPRQEPSAATAAPTPSPSTTVTTPAAEDTGGKELYNKALNLAMNNRPGQAKTEFNAFLAAHPKSALAPNALYWIGECDYGEGAYAQAVLSFEQVAKGYPGHHKASDSLYKIGMAKEQQGDREGAKAAFQKLLDDYPRSELAGAAKQRLSRLSK